MRLYAVDCGKEMALNDEEIVVYWNFKKNQTTVFSPECLCEKISQADSRAKAQNGKLLVLNLEIDEN